jgi:hypothetical protein
VSYLYILMMHDVQEMAVVNVHKIACSSEGIRSVKEYQVASRLPNFNGSIKVSSALTHPASKRKFFMVIICLVLKF